MPRAYAVTVGSLPSSGLAAPTAAYTLGTQVGPPTGTTLTTTAAGLGPADATETITLTHPVSGVTSTLTVQVWRRRKFTGAPTAVAPAGGHYLFDECEFNVANSTWALDLDPGAGQPNQMQPAYVLRRCALYGNDTTQRVLSGHNVWLIDCHVTGGSDAWQGAAWSVVQGCNIMATTDTRDADPHSDGMQMTDTGGVTLHRCWMSAGPTAGANAAVRVGTEFGAVSGVEVYYCGLDRGGYTAQFDGSKAGGVITGVKFKGNRWTDGTSFYGPVDFVNTTITEWVDNAYFGGAAIPQPGG